MSKEAQTLENKDYKALVTALSLEKQFLEEKLKHKELVIQKLQHMLFGQRSEKHKSDSRQGNLFPVEPTPTPSAKATEVNSHSRQLKPKFNKEEEAPEGTFPEHLPRQEIVIDEKPEDIAEADLELVSEKITERLDATPQRFTVKRMIRKVYKEKSTGKLHTSPAPEHAFGTKCKVTESFLVLMVIQKYLWHNPIYRQQQQLKLQGIKISRDSLVRWVIQLSELLQPVARAIAAQIREAPWIHIDETPTRVGKGKRGKKYDQGYFWPILAPDVGVAYLYTANKNYQETRKVLDGFVGTIVSDAYPGYEDYIKSSHCSWQLCWMHSRRNFWDARSSAPKRVEEALSYIARLYELEKEFRDKVLSIEEKTLQRLKHSKPILDEFHSWLTKLSASPEAITDELLSKAISYLLKRWEAACLFVYDGALPLDNGADERAVRPTKLGLKNYLHAASEEGAEASAVFYTLIGSALMQGIHPFYYLLDLLKRIDQPGLTASDLVPVTWKQKFYCEAIPEEYRVFIPQGSPTVG